MEALFQGLSGIRSFVTVDGQAACESTPLLAWVVEERSG